MRDALSALSAVLFALVLVAGPAPKALAEEAAAATVETEAPALGDLALGDPDAPVTVIEYASLTCPHCATFHIETWPELKAKYVDTGKVRFILREVYFDRFGLWASMIARCGGEAGFYPMVDAMLKQQSEWTRAPDITEELMKIGRVNGLSSERMRACLSDRGYAESLVQAYQEHAERDGVQATPSFMVNGEMHRGSMRIDEFSSVIEAALEG